MSGDRRVLVAARDHSMRSAVRDVLAEFSVVETTDEQTTAALAAVCRPDLIVLDATDRSAAARTVTALRNDFRTALTSILYIVDAAPVDGAIATAFGGGDDYVVCPFDTDELAARIRLSLQRSTVLRGVSPLTGLPGNTVVEGEIVARQARGDSFACLYIDLDDFKVFNDEHGFARGDEVIRAVARCIVTVLEGSSPDECFVGHLGGDDFVVLTPSSIGSDVATGIVDSFGSGSGCSVSVGVVAGAEAFEDPSGLAGAAADAKRIAKRQRGSSWAVYGR